MPLLEAFVKQDVFDFCCVATRYFGGILLGAGGLVRAYARCGAAALEASGTGLLREMALCAAALPYAHYENIKRLLISSGAEVTSEAFETDIGIKFSLPSELLPSLKEKVMELTSGSVELYKESVKMG
jgi:putative IMPACT (imprinted ancient) family translation regulator